MFNSQMHIQCCGENIEQEKKGRSLEELKMIDRQPYVNDTNEHGTVAVAHVKTHQRIPNGRFAGKPGVIGFHHLQGSRLTRLKLFRKQGVVQVHGAKHKNDQTTDNNEVLFSHLLHFFRRKVKCVGVMLKMLLM